MSKLWAVLTTHDSFYTLLAVQCGIIAVCILAMLGLAAIGVAP